MLVGVVALSFVSMKVEQGAGDFDLHVILGCVRSNLGICQLLAVHLLYRLGMCKHVHMSSLAFGLS